MFSDLTLKGRKIVGRLREAREGEFQCRSSCKGGGIITVSF